MGFCHAVQRTSRQIQSLAKVPSVHFHRVRAVILFPAVMPIRHNCIPFVLIFRFDRDGTSRQTHVGRPKERYEMTKRQSNVDRQHKLHAIGRSPQLYHRRQIFLGVVGVFGHAISGPIDGGPCAAADEFLDGVVGGKVEERQMNGDAEHDHLHGIEYAGLVLELVRE